MIFSGEGVLLVHRMVLYLSASLAIVPTSRVFWGRCIVASFEGVVAQFAHGMAPF